MKESIAWDSHLITSSATPSAQSIFVTQTCSTQSQSTAFTSAGLSTDSLVNSFGVSIDANVVDMNKSRRQVVKSRERMILCHTIVANN